MATPLSNAEIAHNLVVRHRAEVQSIPVDHERRRLRVQLARTYVDKYKSFRVNTDDPFDFLLDLVQDADRLYGPYVAKAQGE